MRGARRVLLLAIGLIIAAVGGSYYIQKARQQRQAPPPPEELPANISAASTDWVHTQYKSGKPQVEIRAKKMWQIGEPAEFELEDVELRIFDSENGGYDRVTSALAEFDLGSGTLYSEGDAEITLGAAEGDTPRGKLLVIRSSGVRFDTNTGRATTERASSFTFAQGEGHSVGATYDPVWTEVTMHSDVRLRWREADGSGYMDVEAGHLKYKEDQSLVYLSPWSRFKRGPLVMDAGDSVVTVEDGVIRLVDAQKARGYAEYPNRRLDFAAEHLVLRFTEDGGTDNIVGDRGAELVSTEAAAETRVNSERIHLEFVQSDEESVLDHALAIGRSVLTRKPAPAAAGVTPPTRVMRSEVIKALMRPGGEQMKALETHTPGTVEFLPNSPGQKKRTLNAFRLTLSYAENNVLEAFRAAQVETRTENVNSEGKDAPPLLTWSDDMDARFDPSTGAMTSIVQWGNFRYEEGSLRATAERAELNPERDVIDLTTSVRLWDDSGSTSADSVTMNQNTGVTIANGNVSSTRVPDEQAGRGSMILSGEPVHAKAEHMVFSEGGSQITYEGKAVLWQGSNRIRGDRIDIERTRGILTATDNVVNQLVNAETAEITEVRANKLVYLEEFQSAEYTGDVHLDKPGLVLTSDKLRAFFTPEEELQAGDGGDSLHHMFADGDVTIVQTEAERIKTGRAEHVEYYVKEEKVILRGGRPRMADSERGVTQGNELTYYARSDKLVVDGAESRPAVSRLRRK